MPTWATWCSRQTGHALDVGSGDGKLSCLTSVPYLRLFFCVWDVLYWFSRTLNTLDRAVNELVKNSQQVLKETSSRHMQSKRWDRRWPPRRKLSSHLLKISLQLVRNVLSATWTERCSNCKILTHWDQPDAGSRTVSPAKLRYDTTHKKLLTIT